MSKENYRRLGDYIREVDVRNRDLEVKELLGVSISKEFIPSIANTIGTDMSFYKVVEPLQFAYGPVTSRNGDKVSIALYTGKGKIIISQAYTVFEVKNQDELLPEYLMMWFRRPEFDRYARFKSHGSAREIFSWEEMCDVFLPIPPIEQQRKIVTEYEAVSRRIRLNEQTIARLEETAQALYHKMFVDGIDKENLPEGWRMGTLGEIAEYVNDKISLEDIEDADYISTENMLKDKKGIIYSTNKPDNGRGTKFKREDILVSNIRPYFKKIWKASFDGACSNDVLCFRSKDKNNALLLFYTMEQDYFFDYVIAGSNGVKMPRGDKDWIMKYPILKPQKKDIEQFQIRTYALHKYIINSKQEKLQMQKIQSLLLARLGNKKISL